MLLWKGTRSLRVPTLLASLLAALLCAAPLVSHAQAETATTPTSTATGIGLGTVTEYTLPNGLQVLVAPSNASDLVTTDVWVGAGTRRETADTAAHRLWLEIERLKNAGVSTMIGLARALTERGVPTPRHGRVWTHTTVARLVASVTEM